MHDKIYSLNLEIVLFIPVIVISKRRKFTVYSFLGILLSIFLSCKLSISLKYLRELKRMCCLYRHCILAGRSGFITTWNLDLLCTRQDIHIHL